MTSRHVLSESLLRRVEGEYREMAELRLTLEQAKRFWGLDSERCRAVLEALAETRFLRRDADGGYARMNGEGVCTWRTRAAR